MAEIVLSTILSLAIEKLASATWEWLARSWGIHPDLQKLKASLSHIEDLLEDASKKEITDNGVKRWLNRLRHLAYDIDDDLETEAALRDSDEKLEARSSKMMKLISKFSPTFPLSVGMKDKLVDVTSRLQDLEKETDTFGLIVKREKPMNVNRNETSLPDASRIIGREDDKEKLVQKLLGGEPCDENFSIVPIVGMGGLGKTTLARLVYNEPKVKDHFELKAWVCVSDEFHIFNISSTIFQSVTDEKQKSDLNQLQEDLRKKFMGKQFLLVLDDVWCDRRDEWDVLVKPFHEGARGSKIIITTRKEGLLNELRHNHRNYLEMLSHVDALSLFALHAFGVDNFDLHQTLKQYGEDIVNKCGRLPLALKAIGRLLGAKADEEEWKEVLNSEIWRVGSGDEILPALRLSYHDLSMVLKRLFAYCSLFPKDYLFDKEELVLLWMAEGFLHRKSSSSMSAERWGRKCFDELLSRSFFQHAPNKESLYVMHDLMNDMATSMAGDFFSRLEIGMKKEFMKEESKKYRHSSFVCEDYMRNEKFNVFRGANKLRSFLALHFEVKYWHTKFCVSKTCLDNLLPELPLLRVLSLSYLTIQELPESIGSLKHLRYLNLSRTPITHLPEHVCSLYHLQTLIVSGCVWLTKLPKSFLKLKNLRYFDIRDTVLLNKMPVGIGELKNLRILVSKIIIGGDCVFAVTGLKELTDLRGELVIEGLKKLRNPVHAKEVYLSQKKISNLELRWRPAFYGSRRQSIEKKVLHVLKPCNDSLKRLLIEYYGGIEFPRWIGDPSFILLEDIRLEGCGKCTSLPPFGQLHSLKKLHIESMKGLEVWSTNTHIPCLEELCIKSCPKLVEVSVEALPSLRVLEVSNCSEVVLRSLVQSASSSVTNLEIRKISGLTDEVWGGVMEHLGAVEQVRIWECNRIRYLWESEAEASKVLVKLRKLCVSSCENLVRLGEKEESGRNLLLTSLAIWDCKSMERCSCPDSIEELNIATCDSITSVSFPTGGVRGQKLKNLLIVNCKILVLEKEELGVKKASLLNNGMPLLETLYIDRIEDLESIIELRSFIHLTNLIISNCPNMKSIPDNELQNLSMLKYMVIRDCPSLDASFPRGLWPPNLHGLEIGGLKKPISKWGTQNFPASLVELCLYSEEESVLNINWGEMSLTTLRIEGFKNLESVSMGHQHPTSLQHLHIYDCPKMKDLPEPRFLMHSLLELEINECPILSRRCSGRDSDYWPLISHIPCFRIDEIYWSN